MIVRCKRNKQNRNWFDFNLSFESSSFIFDNFKTEKFKRDGADAESPFPLFFSFLPHLRTLAQEKRSEIVFVLGLVGGVFVSIHYCREISEYFSPR